MFPADIVTQTSAPLDRTLYQCLRTKGPPDVTGLPIDIPYTNDLRRVGMLHEPSHNTVGDPYNVKGSYDSRLKGRQFQTNPARRGQAHKQLSSFLLPFEGEPYDKERGLRNSLPAQPKTMRPLDIEGTIGGPYRHMPDMGMNVSIPTRHPEASSAYQPLPSRPNQQSPKNFLTGGPKLGSYGVPHTCIGADPPYMADDYEAQEKVRNSRLMGMDSGFRDAAPAGKVWRTSRPHSEHFSRFGEDDRTKHLRNAALPQKPRSMPPWRPGNPAKKGYNRTIDPFPEYMTEGRGAPVLPPYGSTSAVWKTQDRMKSKPQPPVLTIVDGYDNNH